MRGLPEVRGREPNRLVQGPWDDRRDQQGGRGGRQGGRVRLHREHQRERRRLRGQGGAGLRRPRPQGQDRAREDGRDPRARGARAGSGGELRRLVRARPRPRRTLPGDPRELGQSLPPAGTEDVRVRDRGRARSRARPPPASRSGTPATSRATGSATPSTWPMGRSTSRRGCSGSRRAAPRRWSSAAPSRSRIRSPPPSGSGTRRPGTLRWRPRPSRRARSWR